MGVLPVAALLNDGVDGDDEEHDLLFERSDPTLRGVTVEMTKAGVPRGLLELCVGLEVRQVDEDRGGRHRTIRDLLLDTGCVSEMSRKNIAGDSC
jgi:hypothetical protein